jgi:hypothetical protein
LNQRSLRPGSVVRFKRGSTWTGKLDIYESGTQEHPILFTTYGQGPAPVLQAADDRAISIKASWVIVEGLRLQDAREEGVKIYEGANHNILRDLEITNVGIGIWSWGQNNLISRSLYPRPAYGDKYTWRKRRLWCSCGRALEQWQ